MVNLYKGVSDLEGSLSKSETGEYSQVWNASIHIFGRTTYTHVPKYHRNLSWKIVGANVFFCSYYQSKSYQLWDLDDRNLIIKGDVIFDNWSVEIVEAMHTSGTMNIYLAPQEPSKHEPIEEVEPKAERVW